MKVVFLIISSFVFHFSLAQTMLSTKSKKAIELYTVADNYRVRGNYQQAINLLNQAIVKDKNFAEAYYRLAQTYRSMRQNRKAIDNFEKGLWLTKESKKQKTYWFELGESYFAVGDYDSATKYLTQYIQTELASAQNKAKIDFANKMIRNAVFAKKNSELALLYKQQPLSDTVNCFAMQYFPVLTADQQSLIFTRRLGSGSGEDEDIVISEKNDEGKWGIPKSISKNINTSLNEGTCAISANGRKLIFTSCVGRDGLGSCDLYESNRIGNEWTPPKNLGSNINSTDWESQPSLSADGRVLYFISDRNGGVGRRDLWISVVDDKGSWGKAKNAGKEINTVYDEISPFIHVNNSTLYFASNGLTGFGGYDIYYCERSSNGKWSQPINMGAPINNHEDQFSLFVTADGNKAYYSHENVNDKGETFARLFETLIPKEKRIDKISSYVKGIIVDKDTRQPLKAGIELIDTDADTLIAVTQSDSIGGEYLIVLTEGSQYALYINKEQYLFQSLRFDYTEKNIAQPVTINIELEKIKTGSRIVLNNIFFEFNKYNLQANSIPEMQKIIKFLKDNPTLKIQISGHTDNVGLDTYNLLLSEKRAQAVTDYLIKNGVLKNNVVSVGYGSSQPIADNSSTKGQEKNRRIEFKVLFK
jgi:OmpA-OmpF porin, OOP family